MPLMSAEANKKESLEVRFCKAAGVRRCGILEERHWRTWETLKCSYFRGQEQDIWYAKAETRKGKPGNNLLRYLSKLSDSKR